ncbi:tRNA (adenosine(37)-N6)-threonylcarbamoyltransferase complex transferase subunit TsaD [Candidatus Gottesmanbacteria bacterium]|nr:tRNA (adenosine(37)-N6)-threonylcarbamoyltransferase complex transferase subunit TsaD [Candidatus Gottesmanbacteria bacterium]
MNILAIETSFDETACAVVQDGMRIISNILASSHEMHNKYGGVVPEIAARRQLECIIPVITESLQPLTTNNSTLLHRSVEFLPDWMRKTIEKSIDAIAVTVGPGLIGSLLVGVETAKTIAFVTGKPIIPVNHVLAHMYANFINSSFVIPGLTRNPSSFSSGSRPASTRGELGGRDDNKKIQFPAISLVVSGGHTELYLMKSVKDLTWLGGTLDDAAGECFDKCARILGFGHGGGISIEKAAGTCHPGLAAPIRSFQRRRDPGSSSKIDSGSEAGMTSKNLTLPRPMINDKSLNFSFSGLKTAVMREWKTYHPGLAAPIRSFQRRRDPGSSSKIDSGSEAGMTNAFAHEIQEAITDVLVEKSLRAAKQYDAKSILLSGGVAANTRLREKFLTKLRSNEATKLSFYAPSPALCTDNAVMIGAAAFFNGKPTNWHSLTAQPDLSVEA